MKAWYVDRVHETTTRVCRHCGHPLAWVDGVGWVDKSNDTYDMCEVDRYGNHQPTSSVAPQRGLSGTVALSVRMIA